jgi:hypothetical protein
VQTDAARHMQAPPPIYLCCSSLSITGNQGPKGVSIDSRLPPTISNHGYLMQYHAGVHVTTTHLPETTPHREQTTHSHLGAMRDASMRAMRDPCQYYSSSSSTVPSSSSTMPAATHYRIGRYQVGRGARSSARATQRDAVRVFPRGDPRRSRSEVKPAEPAHWCNKSDKAAAAR